LLNSIQLELYTCAFNYREKLTEETDSYDIAKNILSRKENGFVSAFWCGGSKCEVKMKNETMATIRCIPFKQEKKEGKCAICGKKTLKRVIFAKAY
jgi:prolyl-tRNA synthetase